MLPLKPFYLIRHGESEANAAHLTAGGDYDSPLTEKGETQAKTLAPFLDQLEIMPSMIYASPMIRAHSTATYLNAHIDLELTVMKDLHETKFGEWEGRPWNEVQPLLDSGLTAPGGENNAVFAQRIQNALTEILKKEHDEPPMVVAHGGLFYAMGLLYEYGMSSVQNCHLHYFEPHPEHALFPWKVWQFDVEADRLAKCSAPFCATQAAA